MSTRHALLSASSAQRWLKCPPSVRLCEGMADRSSDYAQQGSEAHELAEHKLKSALGMETQDPTENLKWHDLEMEESAESYAAFVLEEVEHARQYAQ